MVLFLGTMDDMIDSSFSGIKGVVATVRCFVAPTESKKV
jgi:hypothetical protein